MSWHLAHRGQRGSMCDFTGSNLLIHHAVAFTLPVIRSCGEREGSRNDECEGKNARGTHGLKDSVAFFAGKWRVAVGAGYDSPRWSGLTLSRWSGLRNSIAMMLV